MTRSAFHALRRLKPEWPFPLPRSVRPPAGPGRVIGLGVAGLGPQAASMLAGLRGDRRVRVVAGCDPDEELRRRFARAAGVQACASVGELARDAAVEAILLPGADPCIVEQVDTAARHGKHVLIEQPQALTPAACKAMIASCREAGVHLLVGDGHGFDPPYLHARRIIESGEVGRVRMINAVHYTDVPGPDRLAGTLGSPAAQQLGVVRMLAGSRVTRVRAALASTAADARGAYSALIWFEDGTFATLVFSGHGRFDSNRWCGGTDESGLSVEGRSSIPGIERAPPACDGVFARPRQHPHFGPVIVSCEHADLRPMPDAVWIHGDGRDERHALPPAGVTRSGLVDELHRALCGGQGPLHDGEWACATLRICEALQESACKRCDVEL